MAFLIPVSPPTGKQVERLDTAVPAVKQRGIAQQQCWLLEVS